MSSAASAHPGLNETRPVASTILLLELRITETLAGEYCLSRLYLCFGGVSFIEDDYDSSYDEYRDRLPLKRGTPLSYVEILGIFPGDICKLDVYLWFVLITSLVSLVYDEIRRFLF